MTKLYEITQEIAAVLDGLSEADEQTRADTLESLQIIDDFKGKAVNVAGYFQNLDADIEALKEAERRISTRRKAMEGHSASLRDYLLHNMLKTGISKVECPEFSVSLAKCPASVIIDNEELLPDSLMRIRKEPDKAAIKAWLLGNGPLDGAHIVSDKMRLAIK